MTVWTYTLPSEFGRKAAAGCGLFVHSDLRACGLAFGKLASYAEAMARPLPEPFVPVSGALYPGLPHVVPEHLAKQVLAAWLPEVVPHSFVVIALLSALGYYASRSIDKIPSGLQNFMEWVVEGIESLTTDVIGPGGMKYAPFIGTLFLFILAQNMLGAIPGMLSPTSR